MKRIIALLIALMLIGILAFAENEPETAEIIPALEGVVVEVTEDSAYLIETEESGPVLVQIDEETIIDASAEIAAGDYIRVDYDGIMSRSIPAQITADLIRMYSVTGKIIAADPEVNGVLLETETHGEVYAYLPEPWLENTAETITVYFDGAMTMSLPPQISGLWVAAQE